MSQSTTDLAVTFGSFEATELSISAVSPAGHELLAELFGAGAASVTMPKSKGPDFAEYVEARGLTIV